MPSNPQRFQSLRSKAWIWISRRRQKALWFQERERGGGRQIFEALKGSTCGGSPFALRPKTERKVGAAECDAGS